MGKTKAPGSFVLKKNETSSEAFKVLRLGSHPRGERRSKCEPWGAGREGMRGPTHPSGGQIKSTQP